MYNDFYRYYRISTSEAGLANSHFFNLNLPEPLPPILVDNSTTRPQSTGGLARLGYERASIIWDVLTQAQLNTIRRIIESAESTAGQGNGTLWLTLPRSTGEASGQDWVDISGKAHMPEPQPAGVGLYENVMLTINNVTVENEPSTVL